MNVINTWAGLTQNETIPFASYKTALNTYCSFIYEGFDVTMTSYSYDDSLSLDNIGTSPGVKESALILVNSLTPNGCNNGLIFMGNTTTNEGWNMFVESYDSTSDPCEVIDGNSLALDVTYSLLERPFQQKRTSFCIVYQPIGSTWRGVIRGLYSNETMFTSPANIHCTLEFMNFEQVICKLP